MAIGTQALTTEPKQPRVNNHGWWATSPLGNMPVNKHRTLTRSTTGVAQQRKDSLLLLSVGRVVQILQIAHGKSRHSEVRVGVVTARFFR